MGFVQSEYLSFEPLERAFVLCSVQCLAACVGAIRYVHQSTVDLTVWRTNVGHKGAVLTPQESSGPISCLWGKIEKNLLHRLRRPTRSGFYLELNHVDDGSDSHDKCCTALPSCFF